MQQSPVQLKEKLLKSLDEEQNVIDMPGVLQVISALEASPITREVLEQTRIGKFVNEMRRKTTNKDLAKRAKNLVKQWQQQVLSTPAPTPPAPPRRGAAVNGEGIAGRRPQPPAGSKPVSPASRPATPAAATTGSIGTTSPQSTGGSRPSTPAPPGPGSDSHYHNNNNNSAKLSRHHHYTVETNTTSTPATTLSKTDAANKRKRHRNGTSPVENERPAKMAKHEKGKKTNKHEFVANGAVSHHHKVHSQNDILGHTNYTIDHSLPSSNSCDSLQVRSVSPVTITMTTTPTTTKPRGRGRPRKHPLPSPPNLTIKRTSTVPARLQNSDSSDNHRLTSRTPKVKTTAELIQEMSASAGLRVAGSRTAAKIVLNQIAKEKDDIDSPVVPPEAKPRFRRKPGSAVPPVSPGFSLTQTKNEMMEKFLQSQSPHPAVEDPELPDYLLEPKEEQTNDQSQAPSAMTSRLQDGGAGGHSSRISFFVGDDDLETAEVKDEANKTPVDPWSLLPPLNLADIDWTTDKYEVYPPKPVEEKDVERLDKTEIPGVNGQVDGQGEFQDWTRTFTVPSFNGDPLHILPYVSLDD